MRKGVSMIVGNSVEEVEVVEVRGVVEWVELEFEVLRVGVGEIEEQE